MPRPTRRALTLGALLASAAASPALAQSRALGVDTTAFDRNVRAAGRLLPLRERRVALAHRDPRRRVELGRVQRAARGEPQRAARDPRAGRRPTRPRRWSCRTLPPKARATAAERRKVGDLYASLMDSARIERLGTTPLQPALGRRRRAPHERAAPDDARAARAARRRRPARDRRRPGPEELARERAVRSASRGSGCRTATTTC